MRRWKWYRAVRRWVIGKYNDKTTVAGKNGGKAVTGNYPFDLPEVGTIERRIVCAALLQVGNLYETKTNWSENLVAFFTDARWKKGHAWCQYFVNQIGINELGDEWPHGKGGSTQRVFGTSLKNDYVHDKPIIGGMVTWQNKKNKSTGHVGIVVGIKGNTIYTVEGNSSNKCQLLKRSAKKGYYGTRLRGFTDFRK